MEIDFSKPVDSLDAVPEQFRGIFSQGQDGKYVVPDTFKGVAASITGLNTALKAARLEAKNKAPVDLSALAEFGDSPEAILEGINKKITEVGGAKAADFNKQLDAARQAEATKHAGLLDGEKKRSQALQTQLYGLLVENAATSAVAELKGVPELLLPFIKQQVKVGEKDGEFIVQVIDSQGDQRYSGTTGQPMSIKELVAEMKGQEKFGRLFESEQQANRGGGGFNPGGGTKPPAAPNGEKTANQKLASGVAARLARRPGG